MAILYNQNDLTITDEYVQCKGKIKIPFSDIGCVEFFPERSLVGFIRVGCAMVIAFFLVDCFEESFCILADRVFGLSKEGGAILFIALLALCCWIYLRKKDDPFLVIKSKDSGCEIARIDNMEETKLEVIFDVLKSAVSKVSQGKGLSVSTGTGKNLLYKWSCIMVEEKAGPTV